MKADHKDPFGLFSDHKDPFGLFSGIKDPFGSIIPDQKDSHRESRRRNDFDNFEDDIIKRHRFYKEW